jgi:hypothetical protein
MCNPYTEQASKQTAYYSASQWPIADVVAGAAANYSLSRAPQRQLARDGIHQILSRPSLTNELANGKIF